MNEKYFKMAYKEAVKAYKKGEVPVGAVIVKNNKVISKSNNNRQKKHNLLGHAEINCILKAEKKLKDWRLDGCDLYVTLEPCNLCNICIRESRINNVFFLISQFDPEINKHRITRTNDCDILGEKYQNLLTSFFKKLRK